MDGGSDKAEKVVNASHAMIQYMVLYLSSLPLSSLQSCLL
jgi:hypothetical protein